MMFETLSQEAAAIQLAVAQLRASFEACLQDMPKLREKTTLRARKDLQALLRRAPKPSKDLAIYRDEATGAYHLYSIERYRVLAHAAATKVVKPHDGLLQRAGLIKFYNAEAKTLVRNAVAEITAADHRRYTEARLSFEREEKTQRQQRAAARVPLTQEHLEEFMGCYRKQAHPTPAHAGLHMRRLEATGDKGGQLNVYHCGYCTGWHVGHMRIKGGPTPLEDRLLRAWELFQKRPELARAFCLEKQLDPGLLGE
jgi:hypothetical protein